MANRSQAPLADDLTLLVVGCGRMGTAFLKGCIAQGVRPDRIYGVDPSLDAVRTRLDALNLVSSPDALPRAFAPDIVILAIKPAVVLETVARYALAAPRAVFLSIAAGVSLVSLASRGPAGLPIVRAMPNLPAAIGKGVTVACANGAVSLGQHTLCTRLLALIGSVLWVEREELLDAVTAVSGSGPAYLFALIESLRAAGTDLGLDAALSNELAVKTICGAASLIETTGQDAATLRAEVTSPGGTTEAALRVLRRAGGLPDLMREAAHAAAARSKNLFS